MLFFISEVRCNNRDIHLGKCSGDYGSKTFQKRNPGLNKAPKADNKETNQPFLIIAEDEEEDPNDLKDAESVHGNNRARRKGTFNEKYNFDTGEIRTGYSVNSNPHVTRGRRREYSRKPFRIEVPDSYNDYNYNDDYYKDIDYRDDLKKEQSSYSRDPFLIGVSILLYLKLLKL